MNNFIARYATPLTTGLFAVAAISGVALFFHLAEGTFHEMHEWLSMVLLVPFALHLWKNWNGIAGYARRHVLTVTLLASFFLALPFAFSASEREGNPNFKIVPLMTQACISSLAPAR